MTTKEKLRNYFRAGYSGVYLTSYEEHRVEAELAAVASEISFDLYTWTCTDSLVGPMNKMEDGKPVKPSTYMDNDGQPLSPVGVLDMMIPKDGKPVLPEKSIILAKDFHLFVAEANPVLIRKVKDALDVGRSTNRRFVILGCNLKLTPELEKEFTPVEFTLPTREELGAVAKEIADSAGIPMNGNTDAIKDAACGMTTTEAADAFALAVVETGKTDIPPSIVAREKCTCVKKSGLLEVVESRDSISDVGGNQGIKDWIGKRKKSFTKDAKAFGLPVPRGLLLVGIPGCGKTQFAKVISTELNVPLLKLDAGRIFGSLVGESERNLRSVIATVEAVAPCVLMVDEIEKGLSGSKSSGSTDGGTSARVFGTFLQWMNDKTSPVFVVATANDISQLPPEFLRKGRFDELFFVDLPDKDEREDILRIHIGKRQRKPDEFDLPDLAESTQGFTGAELEAVVVEGLFNAFDKGQELSTQDMAQAIANTVPLSRTMASQVEALRQWSTGRARRASANKTEQLHKGRKLSV
jgi:AAA+ superfamily predicted ATPase